MKARRRPARNAVQDTLRRVNDLDLNDLRMFVRVVDRGGFALAARELGLPTSTVSRAIARLEASTRARLLHRTSRSVHLTAEGSAIYEAVSEAVAALERAAFAFEPASPQPSGVLRVTAPTDIGCTFLADVAVAFGERHPLVQLDLALTNRAVSLVGERFDMAVRAATRLEDSSLVVKRLGNLEHALYASPGYIERYGAPATPADLGRHRCIVFRGKALAKTWSLRAHEETIEVPLRGQMAADDFGYIRASVLAGGGVALMPRIVCTKDEAAGRLVRVLPTFAAKGADLCLLYPAAAHVPTRVAAFRDFVAAAFARTLSVLAARPPMATRPQSRRSR
jgi:DNA-binding transcriptional LysR family regulator